LEKVVKEGWLEKKSRLLGAWRKRWFVLDGSTLYSFKQERSYKNPTEAIDLKVYSSVKSSGDLTGKQFSFDVYSSEMGFSLCASSESEKEDWIRALGKAIVLSRSAGWQDD